MDKHHRSCFAAGLLLAGTVTAAQAAPAATTPYIKIDQFGYLTAMNKVAIVVDPQAGYNAAEAFAPATGSGQYQVRRWADDVVVFSGTLQAWRSGATHGQSGDRGWHFDFSTLATAGSYYVWDTVNKVGSGRFEVGANVYDGVLRAALRMYYHQRLNHAKVAPYVDPRWADGAAYERAGQDRSATSRWAKGDVSTARDLSGGWMDAGDTNKYVTFAQSAVLQLLEAYRINPVVFGDGNGIPESGNGVPDLLDEVKWELEFLKRMQNASGTNGFFLKVGVDNYSDVAPPSADARPRYYLPECTSATLAGTAMFASAAIVYKGLASQATYGADLLTRAEAAWARAKVTTSNFTTFQTGCDDGDIKAGDADVDPQGQIESAVVAAIYLYEATAKAEYRTFVESNYTRVRPYSLSWWGPYWAPVQVALLRFAGLGGVTAAVATNIRTQKGNQNGVISVTDFSAGTDLYRAHLADAEFNWGHNMTRSNAGLINLDFATFGINPTSAATYRQIAEQHLHWLHGANPMGLVMLSNMASLGAESSVNELYHTWFANGTAWDNAQTSSAGPAPGYVPGGPNRTYTGSVAGITNQPPQKAYKDWNTGWPENAWEITEPAIYYQAAYVQLLARLMTPGTPDTQAPTAPTKLAASAITATGATLKWTAATDNVGVTGYDLYRGTTLLTGNLVGTTVTLTGLSCSTTYTLTLKARDAAGNTSAASTALSLKTVACPTSNTAIYSEALDASWVDWSWNSTRNFASAAPVKVGTRAIRADLAAWGGVSLRHASGVALSPTSTLRFWAYSPVAVPLRVYVQTQDSNAESGNFYVTLPAGVWTDVVVTKAQMGNPNLVKRINLQLNSATATTVNFDEIRVTK